MDPDSMSAEGMKRCPFCAEEILAAAIKCKHCSSDLTGTPAPFRLSAPEPEKPKATSTLKNIIAILVMLGVAGLVYDSISGATHPDVRTIPDGTQGGSDGTGGTDRSPPPYRITAVQLFRDYEENEVATNQKIGNAPIEVSGVLASIDEDFENSVVLRLISGNEFEPVSLTLSDKADRSRIGGLRKGEPVDVVCTTMARIVGAPQGGNCILLSVQAPQ